MSTFVILPFTCDDKKVPHSFAYTTQGAVRLTSLTMQEALKSLKICQTPITQEALHALLAHYEIEPKAGQVFLERMRIIGLIPPTNAVAIYTSEPRMGEALLTHIQANDAVDITLTDDPLSLAEPTLLIALQATYCPSFSRQVTQMCTTNHNLLLAHGYFIYRHFISDGLFSAAMGLPDHFTMIEHLTSLERSANFRPSSWAELFCGSPSQRTSIPTLPMTALEKNAGLHMFYSRLRNFFSYGTSPFHVSDISTIWELNLDTGIVEKHRSTYSSLASSYALHEAPQNRVPEATS